MADEKVEKKSRAIASFISVGLVLVIGLPVWWNTTKVYRATLPYDDIQGLSNYPLNIRVGITIIFEQGEEKQKEFVDSLSAKLAISDSRTGDENNPVHFNYSVKARNASAEESQLLASSLDSVSLEDLDDQLQKLWHSSGSRNEYKFLVLSEQGMFTKLAHYAQCFVGKYRHAIVLHDENQTHVAEIITRVTRNVFRQERVIKDSFTQLLHADQLKQNETIEKIRDLKSVTGFHISFSLINDEPETGILNWNIKESISDILQPFIDRISLFDISIDSQILHYSGVNLRPKRDGEVNYLTTEDLPHMINPIEGKLGSFVSLNPSLNFIVFVPPRKQTPLKIRDADGNYSPTNAFLSPRWGGVLIHNVYNRSEASDPTPPTISLDVTSIMKVFLTQIRLLVGIRPVTSQKGVIFSSVLNSGATDWETDNLLLAKTLEYLSSSIKTLTSLTQLMDKVKNMIIDDKMKTDIESAVIRIAECQYLVEQGNIFLGFLGAKEALQLSEKAFYDPSVLELLYFPDDQKFAIYIPLFLPMSLPLLVSLFVAVKWLRNKNSDEDNQNKNNEAG